MGYVLLTDWLQVTLLQRAGHGTGQLTEQDQQQGYPVGVDTNLIAMQMLPVSCTADQMSPIHSPGNEVC